MVEYSIHRYLSCSRSSFQAPRISHGISVRFKRRLSRVLAPVLVHCCACVPGLPAALHPPLACSCLVARISCSVYAECTMPCAAARKAAPHCSPAEALSAARPPVCCRTCRWRSQSTVGTMHREVVRVCLSGMRPRVHPPPGRTSARSARRLMHCCQPLRPQQSWPGFCGTSSC